MPRLSVKAAKSSSTKPKPPSIRIGGFELLGVVALLLAWVVGAGFAARALLVDVGCLDASLPWRSEVGEMIVCAAAAGPRGWLFLTYAALGPAATSIWLRRKFSSMLKP